MRILVIDDEPMICMLLTDYIEELGHQVMGKAYSTVEALRFLSNQEPELAILDVNLAGQSSEPVAEACAIKGVPVIIMTGYNGDSLPESLRDYPVLAKPFDVRALGKMIGTRT